MYDEERKRKKQENIEHEQWKGFTVRYFMALKDLMYLLNENDASEGGSAERGLSDMIPRVPLKAQSPLEIPKFR